MNATASTDASPHDQAAPPDPAVPGETRPGPRFGTVAVALAVVVGLLLGYAAGWLTPSVTRPGDTSVEAGFARDMTSHHAQAVEMGLIAFRSATDQGVRQIGGDIALNQQGEIGAMQTWLREWGLDPTGSQPPMAWMPDGQQAVRDGLMPGMATPEQMAALRSAEGVELDILFLDLMIDHHLGGIHMVDAVLDRTDEPEIIRVATTMKNTQQTELNNLRFLLDKLDG